MTFRERFGLGLIVACLVVLWVTTIQNVYHATRPARAASPTMWEAVPGTSRTYRMQVEDGTLYLYWDPPRPNAMTFVPSGGGR